MQRQFGRVIRVDRRDEQFAVRRTAGSARVARTWDVGRRAADQGATPSCVGHAWAHWLQCAPRRQWLDPRGLYDVCKFYDEYEGERYDGTSVRAGAKVLKKLGFLAEYRWLRALPALVHHVLDRGPVVVGADWYAGMDAPDAQGLVHAEGDVLGGHAFLIFAADTRRQDFRFKQSWGLAWGDRGTARISFADVWKLLQTDGEACAAVEAVP